MSRNRGRRLVELCQETTNQLMNDDIITHGEMEDQERASSPVPDNDEIITPEFMALYEDVFQDPIDENSFSKQLISPAHSSQSQIIKDVNIHTATEANSPSKSYSPYLVSVGQKPSPMTYTPQSVETLFSCSAENYESDKNEDLAEPLISSTTENCEYGNEHTPMPSPYCAFSDNSDNQDEPLVQSTILKDLTLIPANSSKNDISPGTPLRTIFNEQNSDLDVNVLSVATSLISNECSTIGSETSTPKSKRKSKTRSDMGRKRNIHVEDWVATKRKRLCNLGQEYTSRRGSVTKAKKMKASCTISCRLKCCESFTEEIRSELFSNFWGTGNHVMQWQIISKYVFKKNKKSCTNLENVNVRRLHTLHYHLPLKSNDDEVILRKVCKTMFLNTFSISNDFVYTALQKKLESTDFDSFIDGRGRHKHHHRVVTDEMKQSVLDHVNSYAPMESHYVRKNSSIKYLDPSLSFLKMFNMYSQWCKEYGYNSKVQTVRQYKDIVNDNLKIGFHVPKKDQCDLCHQFKNTPAISDGHIQKYEKHQKEKEFSRKLKQETKLKAANENKTACIVFDFQKVLNAPHGNISIYYYKRKLNVYNFTVYDMASKEAFCYMWDEQIAKRGANEVESCIYDFMCKLATKGVTEVYLWSDNCGGQNRNRIVYYMYLLVASKLNIKVCHRFMEKGHTQNEGDSVHALIEKSAKGKEIYSPDEWFSVVRWAKSNGKPYTVIEVKQDMILDFKKGIVAKNWTKNFCNDKVSWNKIKEIEASPENEGVLSYKYSLGDDERHHIQCFKKLSTRQTRVEPLPQKAYKNVLPIKKAKYKDLVYFCDNNIVPQKYHNFYKNLSVTETNETDVTDEET